MTGMLLLQGCGSVGREHIDAGMTAIGEMRYEDALACFTQAEEAGEDSRLIYRGQGIAYIGLMKYAEAVQAFEASLAQSDGRVLPVDVDMNYYMAAAYTKNGNLAEAVTVYDNILALEPQEADAYFLRGSVLLKQGNFEKAKADFDQTIVLVPTDYDRLIRIYEVLAQYGYKEAGKEYLQTTMDSEPKGMADYDKGRICYYLERYEDARDYLEKARDKTGAEAVLYLGRTWEILGDYNYAASVYLSYLGTAEDAEIYNQLGLCKMKMNDYQAALEAFQSGMKVENCPIMQTLKYNEIVACENLGEFKKAAVLMNTYLSLYPDDADAIRENAFLQTR